MAVSTLHGAHSRWRLSALRSTARAVRKVASTLDRPGHDTGSHFQAPTSAPIDHVAVEKLVSFLQGHDNVLVVTGAGCSTESGIPDYRSPLGAYSTGFKPMTHQQFEGSGRARQRYWARSFVGWQEFAAAEPTGAHVGLSRLQGYNWAGHIITQNVDRLHHLAGARYVTEVHGTTHEVVCLGCGAVTLRLPFQKELARLNPELSSYAASIIDAARQQRLQRHLQLSLAAGAPTQDAASKATPLQRPDGDIELDGRADNFVVPDCQACGGALKPNVVFFGGSVPKPVADRASALAEGADAMLIVGSTVSTYSVFRLVQRMRKRGRRVAAVNIGDTRADSMLDFKVSARVGEVMMLLAGRPELMLPRVPS